MTEKQDTGGRHPLKTPTLIAVGTTMGVAINSQHLMFTALSGAFLFIVVFGLAGIFHGGKKVVNRV